MFYSTHALISPIIKTFENCEELLKHIKNLNPNTYEKQKWIFRIASEIFGNLLQPNWTIFTKKLKQKKTDMSHSLYFQAFMEQLLYILLPENKQMIRIQQLQFKFCLFIKALNNQMDRLGPECLKKLAEQKDEKQAYLIVTKIIDLMIDSNRNQMDEFGQHLQQYTGHFKINLQKCFIARMRRFPPQKKLIKTGEIFETTSKPQMNIQSSNTIRIFSSLRRLFGLQSKKNEQTLQRSQSKKKLV